MSSHPDLYFADITGGLSVGSGSIGSGLTDGSVTDVIIPSAFDSKDIVEIGIYAFRKTKIVSVFIPKTIQHINQYSFYLCYYLSSVFFEPDSSLTKIDLNSFRSCTSLEKIDLPSSLQTIISASENRIFQDSNKLQCVSYHGISDFSLSYLFTNSPTVHVSSSYPFTTFGSIDVQKDGELCHQHLPISPSSSNVPNISISIMIIFQTSCHNSSVVLFTLFHFIIIS